ncbi:MAG: Stress responsive alpha-beta barrel protein [Paenibacillaceae bacterium]|nr:Stress responsive alpha-beta barrel protein [Paenibacillaceae bacterium]
MITNNLLIKLKERNRADAEQAKAQLLSMQGKIGVLAGIQVELDIRHSASSYDLLLITRFAAMEDMEAYLAHPIHVEVSKYIAEVMEASASVCYGTS